MRWIASAAVKPAVPRIIDSRSVRPAGSGTIQSPGTRSELREAAVVALAEAHPVHDDRVARAEACVVATTRRLPAASIPALSGKRFRIFPRPVTASASL